MYQFNNSLHQPSYDKIGKLLEYRLTKNSKKILRLKMTELDVKKLTSCNSDWELNQYTLLSRLKDWERNFRKNKLFPDLKASLKLNEKLQDILQENLESKWWLESEVKTTVINNHHVMLDKARNISSQLNLLLDFVEWALKLNRPVMEEGLIIKDFVESNLQFDGLNLEMNYRGRGYFTLSDNRKELFNIYFYDIKWEWNEDNPNQKVKTQLIRSIPKLLIDKDEKQLMEEFVRYSQPLYKPVVYMIKNELDFPYNETILPVAIDKLVQTVMK